MTKQESYWVKKLNAVQSTKYSADGVTRWDINGDVYLRNQYLTKLPIAFGIVTGDFDCYSNQLKTLEGSPIEVGGNFDCSDNKLETLEGAPKKVDGSFVCSHNELLSLEGAPLEITGSLSIYNNRLTTLKGITKHIGESLYFDGNPLEHLNDLNNVQIKGEICICENDFDSIIKALYNTNLDTLEYTLHNHTYWFENDTTKKDFFMYIEQITIKKRLENILV